jgi:flagellar hook assembly protein FlgD
LEVVDEFGSVLARHIVLDGSLPVGVKSPKSEVKKNFILSSNYPNPLSSAAATQWRYSLPAEAFVNAAIYDLLGRHVRSLQNRKQAAGAHVLFWDGKDDRGGAPPNGIYLLSMKIIFQNGRQQTVTQKIALIK